MEGKFWQTMQRLAIVLVIVAVLAAGIMAGIQQFSDPEVAQGDGYATACYREQGGSKWVCGSGGEMEFQSGAVLDVQAGATVNLPATTAGNTIITGTLAVSGTTQIVGAISNPTAYVTIADHLDVQNTLNYGTSNLYPIGSEDSNFQFSWGSNTITGSLAITQKVGQPTMAWCTLAQTPVNANGNVCTTLIVGNVVTVSVWLSNSTVSAAGVAVSWLVIGIP